MCLKVGKFTPMYAADHIKPHKGDHALFFDPENIQSLCREHHDRDKQSEEALGYSNEVGEDGYPADARHPFNTGEQIKRWGYSIPHGVQPSGIPVMLICGPPASGKSTYVREHVADGDTVIDFDAIRKIVGGQKWDQDPRINAKAFAYRDKMIMGLADKRRGRAWLIAMAPAQDERRAWVQALGNVTEVIVLPSKAQCLAQLDGDPERAVTARLQRKAIDRWYAAYNGPASPTATVVGTTA
jgi:5-methylcytosine-specific restriction protein A